MAQRIVVVVAYGHIPFEGTREARRPHGLQCDDALHAREVESSEEIGLTDFQEEHVLRTGLRLKQEDHLRDVVGKAQRELDGSVRKKGVQGHAEVFGTAKCAHSGGCARQHRLVAGDDAGRSPDGQYDVLTGHRRYGERLLRRIKDYGRRNDP